MAKKKAAKKKTPKGKSSKGTSKSAWNFTPKQGQYLAFIYWYRKVNGTAPAEADMVRFFGVTPPSVHQMIVKLQEKGLIARQPGVARSTRVLVPPSELPHLISDDDEADVGPATSPSRSAQATSPQFYTLEVFLVGGPVPDEFTGKEISRTIQISGDQTLEQLHEMIFQAYDRWDEHLYEFQFGRGPHDPDGSRYVLPMVMADGEEGANVAGDLTETTIESLKLKVDQPFGYWFDYGDDWYHQIVVLEIDSECPHVTLPRVIERVGDSPPQYPEPE